MCIVVAMNASVGSPRWIAIRSNIERRTLALLRKHGLTDWVVTFDQSTSRAGQCNHSWKRITFGIPFMQTAGEEQVKNTILHEVAHAVVGPKQGHGSVWKAFFISIGGNGSAHSEAPQSMYTHENFLWIGTCACCGAVTGMKRAPQNVYGCVACPPNGNKLSKVFNWSKAGIDKKPSEVSVKYAARYAQLEEKFGSAAVV